MSFNIPIDFTKSLADLVGSAKGGDQVVPEGTYDARITHVKPGASSSGELQIGLRFATTTGHKFWSNFQVASPYTGTAFAIITRAGTTDWVGGVNSENINRLVGVPVHFNLKHSKRGEKVFYNLYFSDAVPAEQRVSVAAQAATF